MGREGQYSLRASIFVPASRAIRLLLECGNNLAILADEELRDRLAVAISQLPERLQLVVQLYFVEELNLSEIAETIQVSVPRVHQLKAQAIDRLRIALAGIADII